MKIQKSILTPIVPVLLLFLLSFASGAKAAGLLPFSGGAVESVAGVSQTVPTAPGAFGSPIPVGGLLPGASLTVVIPAGDSDLVVLTFSAECFAPAGSTAFVEIWHSAGPGPIGPIHPTSPGPAAAGDMILCSNGAGSSNSGMRSVTVGERWPAGAHTFQVRVRDFGATLIDDWTFTRIVSN